jgi:hypothetical protein
VGLAGISCTLGHTYSVRLAMALKLLRCAALERLHVQVWCLVGVFKSVVTPHYTPHLLSVSSLELCFLQSRLRCGLTDGLQNCRVFRLLRNISAAVCTEPAAD